MLVVTDDRMFITMTTNAKTDSGVRVISPSIRAVTNLDLLVRLILTTVIRTMLIFANFRKPVIGSASRNWTLLGDSRSWIDAARLITLLIVILQVLQAIAALSVVKTMDSRTMTLTSRKNTTVGRGITPFICLTPFRKLDTLDPLGLLPSVVPFVKIAFPLFRPLVRLDVLTI